MKYHVEKSIVINKPLSAVKKYVADFNTWNIWSPWTIAEPDCRVDVTGKAGSLNHEMSWEGNIIGSGTNKLIKISDSRLDYDLNFLKPFKSHAETSFIFKKVKNGTKVTWTMDSSLPFFMFFMVNSMKNWIGMDYDRGLRMLKEVLEKGKIHAKTTNNGIVDLDGFSYVGIQRTIHMDEIEDTMQKDFDRLIDEVVIKNKKSAKHWLSLYPKMNMNNMMMTYIAAVSDEELGDVDLGDDYVRGVVGSGKALEIKHNGSYDFIGNAWSMGMMYMRGKKIKGNGIPFEQYWNSPKEVKPEQLKSSVFFPVKG